MSLRQFVPPSFKLPFSHSPGIQGWLVGSKLYAQFFPTAFFIYSNKSGSLLDCGEQKTCIKFLELGPVSNWTVFFDILRQKTIVEGVSKSGFFRFELIVEKAGIFFKSLKNDFVCEHNGKQNVFEKGKKYVLLYPNYLGIEETFSSPRFKGPQLLLGKNKDPNVDRIVFHPDMLEILPLWYQMAMPKAQHLEVYSNNLKNREFSDTEELRFDSEKSSPFFSIGADFSESKMDASVKEKTDSSGCLGISSLLGSLSHVVERKERLHVIEKFMQFFKTGISSFFVPKKEDTLFLGYPDPLLPKNFALEDVHEVCVALIRSLFLEEKENKLFLLPCLPKECVCGHLLRERLLSGSEISLEWRKGMIRRVLIHPIQDETISLVLQRGIKAFCLTVLGGPHARKTTLQTCSLLELKQGKRYLLDNFTD